MFLLKKAQYSKASKIILTREKIKVILPILMAEEILDIKAKENKNKLGIFNHSSILFSKYDFFNLV